jgi:hypothetical protein
MLYNLDDQVRDCLQRAADCAQRAKDNNQNLQERLEWVSLRDRYVALAGGIEGHYRNHGRIRGVRGATAMRPYRPR